MTINKKHMMIAMSVGVILATLGTSLYFFLQYQKTQALLKNPSEAAKEESRAIVARVAKLVDVPPHEEPTIATVSDKEKLREQTFFARAENGDKVLFFPSTKKAILYRPSTNKIIEMSSVNVSQIPAPTPVGSVAGINTTQPTPTSAPQPVTVAIYNGTITAKLANNMESYLKSIYPLATVVKKENAATTSYDKTVVVDVSGKNSESAQSIARVIDGVVGQLPSKETKPDSGDILIIIGKTYQPH